MQRRILYSFVLFISLISFTGCSGSRPALQSDNAAFTSLYIPAGVDSTVADYADSLAATAFVSIDEQEAAAFQRNEGVVLTGYSDTLWTYLEMGQDSSGSVSGADAEAALRAANQAVGPLNQLIQLTQSTDLDSLTALRRQEVLLDQAQDALEASIRLNPFDLQTQGVLAQVYTAQAQRLGQARAYEEAIGILEKLTRLRPDQHTLFIALGNNYYQLKKWNEAASNYSRAEIVYLETYDLVATDAPSEPDAALLYQYATRQADVHVNRRDANAAMAAYERALELAPDNSEVAFIKGEIEWLNWDRGNLTASFARDSLIVLEQEGQLEDAERGFAQLLPQLQSQQAIDETEWRLAAVQYKVGKGDEAADRLLNLVRRVDINPETGVPMDSLATRYLDTFGAICFNQAMVYLGEKRDNRTALKYLEQAVQFPWKDRARAYLESAKLLRSNVSEAKRRAHEALKEADMLTATDQKELYGLLATFYRTEGDFDEARKFLDLYREME